MEGFRECFAELEDPRTGNATRHDLVELLFISLLACLCGAQSCVDMADFGEAKEDLLRGFLKLEHGPPSHDTFSRVFRLLEPKAFHTTFQRFMAAFARSRSKLVAVDGKSLRRSYEAAARGDPLHLVSAWASEERLVLGQMAIPEGSNEITAVPALLALLDLDGVMVTMDAMHCQKKTAEQIVEAGGDYLMRVKSNQPSLHQELRLFFADAQAPADDVDETVDGDHGRIETRRVEVLHDVEWLARSLGWPGLACLGKRVAWREVDGKSKRHESYYIASRRLSAAELNRLARGHWGIENQLHWVLDIVMGEDQARNRKDHGPENLALLRLFALNIIKANKKKGSNRLKFKRAGWNDKFLHTLISEIA